MQMKTRTGIHIAVCVVVLVGALFLAKPALDRLDCYFEESRCGVINQNPRINCERPVILYGPESGPVIQKALRRIHARLVQTKGSIPCLVDVEKADIQNGSLSYKRGRVIGGYKDAPSFGTPDSAVIEFEFIYPYSDFGNKSPYQPDVYRPRNCDEFACMRTVFVASGYEEINKIYREEMARLVVELQETVCAKKVKAGEEIHAAVASGDVGWVKRLLVERPERVGARDHSGFSPLHWAKDKALAEWLLAHGADINARDRYSRTPLHWAAVESREMMKLLVEHGADINAVDSGGHTPLDISEAVYANTTSTPYLRRHGGKRAAELRH